MPQRELAWRGTGERFEGDLRRTLIAAAVDVLGDVGAENVSLREVARRSGVSHAAPAHHFGDKAGLLTAVAVRAFARFGDHLVNAIAADPMTPVDQLPTLGRAYAEFAQLHPGQFQVMF